MPSLEEVLGSSERNFLIIAHRARSDEKIFLNDLCGASGRWDGVARCITSSLFLSHDMRRDTSVHILLLGPDDPPKLLSINGKEVKYLNPDERASSALMKKCLRFSPGEGIGSVISPSPGITITRADLESVIDSIKGPLLYLHEDGEKIWEGLQTDGKVTFLLSDDKDLMEDEEQLVRMKSDGMVSLGDRVLHAHMAITVVNHYLDRKEDLG